jgi:hypothetical protein
MRRAKACSSAQIASSSRAASPFQRTGEREHELGGEGLRHALDTAVVDRDGDVLRHDDVDRADQQHDLERHGDRGAVAAAGQRVGLVPVDRRVPIRPDQGEGDVVADRAVLGVHRERLVVAVGRR